MIIRLFILAAFTCLPQIANAEKISGTAGYRERIALSAKAAFQTNLFETSDAKQAEVGQHENSVLAQLQTERSPLDQGNEPTSTDGIFGGMMTYMADAALFEDCQSGLLYPIDPSGDYLAMERAYLQDRTAPGEPLYVVFEGGFALRPAMEGPDRKMAVVDTFIRTRSDTSCERQMADAALRNTYWRLEKLDGIQTPTLADRTEPHLMLEGAPSNNFSATVGCNRMRGSFEQNGNTLRFGAAASTMMACPAPLDQLERQFSAVITQVASYGIEGETLILRDASGDIRAIFTAVYF